MDRLLYRPLEAAALLGIGRSRFYELMAEGAINSIKIGHSRRVSAQALERYVKDLESAATQGSHKGEGKPSLLRGAR